MSSNLDVNNLTVHGHIVFSDQSVQETSLSNVAAKVQSLSRNPISNTLSITNDDLILNKSLQVSETLNAPLVKLQSLTFMGDIDEFGEPTDQTRSFSNIIYQRIQTSKEQLDEIIPEIIDPPNKRLKLSGDGYLLQATNEGLTSTDETSGTSISLAPDQLTVSGNNISILASANGVTSINQTTGLSAQFQSDMILVNGNPAFSYGQLTSLNLKMADDVSNTYSYVTPYSITLTNANGKTIAMDNTDSDASCPKVSMSFEGHTTYLQTSGISADGFYQFSFDNALNFFKLQNPFSLRQVSKLDGEYIEKNEPLIVTENVSQIRLYGAETYLDSSLGAGWSTRIVNKSGSDLLITYNDGKQWFSHANGAPQNEPIVIKKWALVTLVLIFSTEVNDYLWVISQF